MKKIFTLLAAVWCSMAAMAQDIQLETKDGTVIPNGSTVTIKSEMVDQYGFSGQMDPHIYLKNLTDSNQGVYAIMKVVKPGFEYPQICGIQTCYLTTAENPVAKTGMGGLEASSSIDLQIHLLYQAFKYPNYMNMLDACTIELSVWTNDKPNEVITSTITITNDPAVLDAANIAGVQTGAHVVYAKDNVFYYNFSDVAARSLQIFDVAGQMQKELRLNSEAGSLPLEGMSKGIYLYRVVENGKNALSGKFLVK